MQGSGPGLLLANDLWIDHDRVGEERAHSMLRDDESAFLRALQQIQLDESSRVAPNGLLCHARVRLPKLGREIGQLGQPEGCPLLIPRHRENNLRESMTELARQRVDNFVDVVFPRHIELRLLDASDLGAQSVDEPLRRVLDELDEVAAIATDAREPLVVPRACEVVVIRELAGADCRARGRERAIAAEASGSRAAFESAGGEVSSAGKQQDSHGSAEAAGAQAGSRRALPRGAG